MIKTGTLTRPVQQISLIMTNLSVDQYISRFIDLFTTGGYCLMLTNCKQHNTFKLSPFYKFLACVQTSPISFA